MPTTSLNWPGNLKTTALPLLSNDAGWETFACAADCHLALKCGQVSHDVRRLSLFTSVVPAHRRCGHIHDKTEHTTRRRPRNACPQTRRPEPCTGESASSSGWSTRKYLSSANEPRLSSHHLTRAGLYVDVRCLREPAPSDHRRERRHHRAVTFRSLDYFDSAIDQKWGPAPGLRFPVPTALRSRTLIKRQLKKHL